jgi:hypothetical protein
MEIPTDFDIDRDSANLKDLVAQYDSETFIADIAVLLTLIDFPRIPYYPFQGLDSPLRQLTYLASLNLSSHSDKVSEQEVSSNNQWREIVKQTITVRAGYYEQLLPGENDDEAEFYKFYKVAMPVFNNYFDTGDLNFEEQEVERVSKLFTPFDSVIITELGLSTAQLLDIYHLIDNVLEVKLNTPLAILRKDEEASRFWNAMFEKKVHPQEWEYSGDNQNIFELVNFMKNRGEKFTISKDDLYDGSNNGVVDLFLDLFSIERVADDSYVYYTQPNKVLLNPIFRKQDGRYLIIYVKQIVHAIYKRLHEVLSSSTKRESFFTFRGKALQEKTVELLEQYFGSKAHIYNEYKVDGKAQDVLLLYQGLALIIENKAKREFQFSGVPDTMNIYKQFAGSFKKSIRDGYQQCWRIKDKFYYEDEFTISDLKNNPVFTVKTSKYHSVFSIIITQDKFREPQINLPDLLELHEDDDTYPLSISIDDFEVLILTLIKLKIGPGRLIRFLKIREQLQGRLKSNDELEIWGGFLVNKKFEVPDDPQMHYQTFPEMADIYDQLYKKGLGFKNEKNLDKKKSGRYLFFEPTRTKQ